MTIFRIGRAGGRALPLIALGLTLVGTACLSGTDHQVCCIGAITGIDSSGGSGSGGGASGAPGHEFALTSIVGQSNDSSGFPFTLVNYNPTTSDSVRIVDVALDSSLLFIDTSTTGVGEAFEINYLEVQDVRTGSVTTPPPVINTNGTIAVADTIPATFTFNDTTEILTLEFTNTVGSESEPYQQVYVYLLNDSLQGVNTYTFVDSAGTFPGDQSALMTYTPRGTFSANAVPRMMDALRSRMFASGSSSSLSALGFSHHAIVQMRADANSAIMKSRLRMLRSRAVRTIKP